MSALNTINVNDLFKNDQTIQHGGKINGSEIKNDNFLSKNSWLLNSSKKLIKIFSGGGIISHSIENESIFEIILITSLVLIIKGFIVMYSYNYLIEKIWKHFDYYKHGGEIKKLTIWESIILILLFSNLFGRY